MVNAIRLLAVQHFQAYSPRSELIFGTFH